MREMDKSGSASCSRGQPNEIDYCLSLVSDSSDLHSTLSKINSVSVELVFSVTN